MKKAVTALLFSAAMVSLTSCGSSGSSSASSTGAVTSQSSSLEVPDSLREANERMLEEVSRITPSETATKPEKPMIDSKAEAALKAYVQTALTSSAEETIKYIYPESIYKGLVGTSAMNNFGSGGSSDNGLEEFSITKCTSLSSQPYYSAAKTFYDQTADSNNIKVIEPIIISSAYDVEMTVKASYGGKTETDVVPAVAVHIVGDDWKVIPMSGDELAHLAE